MNEMTAALSDEPLGEVSHKSAVPLSYVKLFF